MNPRTPGTHSAIARYTSTAATECFASVLRPPWPSRSYCAGVGVVVKHRCRGRLCSAAAVAVFTLAGGWVGNAQALAATRYAAPSTQGSGDCSSPANACTLATAVSGSSQGDTVILAGDQGTYGTASTPLTSTIQGPASGDAPGLIEGASGQPRPVIYTNADPGFNLDDEKLVGGQYLASAVTNLDIEELASGLPTALDVEGNVDHVIVRSLNGAYDACSPLGLPSPQTEVISNSLCVAGGFNSSALGISANGSPQTKSITLRNDTLYATGQGSNGIDFSIGGFTVGVAARNVIAHGDQSDVSVNQYSGGSLSVTLDHSNYATVSRGGGASATPPGTNANQTAAPAFVDVAGGNFHEAAGSPTIDAGLTEAANGTTDLDGNPRTIGSSTDIGAYEAAEAPTVVPGLPTSISTNQATLNVSVNPNFSATTVQAYVGTSTTSEAPLPAQGAGAGLSAVALAFSAGMLKPGTVYHYHFVATNGVGASSSTDQTFTTVPVITHPLPGRVTLVSRKAIVHGSSARIRLSCSAGSSGCRGTLVLSQPVKLRKRSGHHLRTVTVVRTVGSAKFAIAAGQTMTVVVNLRRTVRRALANSSHPRLTLAAAARRSDGGLGTRAKIVLTIARKPRHHP